MLVLPLTTVRHGAQLFGGIPSRPCTLATIRQTTWNRMLSKYRGQCPLHWYERLCTTLQTCPQRLVLHAFDCSHRWSSTTDVEIPSLKAGAAMLKASWARTPRRFWMGGGWCPSEAARPQVRVGPIPVSSMLLTDGGSCRIVYLFLVFSVWPQEGTKATVWEWWWRCSVASWLVPSTAATSEPGKSQTVLLTW